jgi:hypothetical protein
VMGVMTIGYRLQGWTSALAAGFLMAILPTAVRYSQEIGQYAPMQCFLAWNVAVMVGLVRDPGRRGFVLWVLLAAAAAWTYYGCVIPIVVVLACYGVEAGRAREWLRVRRALWALAAFGVSILPLVVWFLPQQLRRGPTEHALAIAGMESVAGGLREVVARFPETIAFPMTGWPCSRTPAWLTIVLFMALAALAWRRQRRFAVWFTATLVVYAVLGALRVFPFGARYSIILSPVVVPLLASAISIGTPRAQRICARIAFGLVCVSCLASLPNRDLHRRLYGEGQCIWPETEDLGPVTQYWYEHRTPEQPTYVYYGAAPAFAYYLDLFSGAHASRPPDWFLSCWRGDATAACQDGDVFYGRWVRDLSPDEKLVSLFDTLGRMPDEFWFVAAHSQESEDVEIGKVLQKQYRFLDVSVGQDAVAVLLRRRSP